MIMRPMEIHLTPRNNPTYKGLSSDTLFDFLLPFQVQQIESALSRSSPLCRNCYLSRLGQAGFK